MSGFFLGVGDTVGNKLSYCCDGVYILGRDGKLSRYVAY